MYCHFRRLYSETGLLKSPAPKFQSTPSGQTIFRDLSISDDYASDLYCVIVKIELESLPSITSNSGMPALIKVIQKLERDHDVVVCCL